MNAVNFVPHVLDTEDISSSLDLITYLINGDKKRFAVAKRDTIKVGNACIVVERGSVPKNDPRFYFASASAFDPALALNELPAVSEFLTETYVPIDNIDFKILVFGG